MNDIEIEVLEKEIEEEEIRNDVECRRARRILHIRNKVLKPKGLIKKRCPRCNKNLQSKILEGNYNEYKMYSCECGYEYVIENPYNFT